MNKHDGIKNLQQHFRIPQTEDGNTEVSLENADALLRERGLPEVVELVVGGPGKFETRLTWTDFKSILTGLSWGYDGVGPHGLDCFLSSIGVGIGPYWNASLLTVSDRGLLIRGHK